MNKETIEVEVDGEIEQRCIDYSVYRGKDEYGQARFIDYPVLLPKEHLDEKGIKVFTSIMS